MAYTLQQLSDIEEIRLLKHRYFRGIDTADTALLAQQAFGSPQLMEALSRLDGHLRAARPGEDWDSSAEFAGDNPLGMGAGAQALADIAELEQLA